MSTSSNPFAALAGKFADGKASKARKTGAAARPPETTVPEKAGKTPVRNSKESKKEPASADLGEENALFLDAVRTIKPLSRDKARDNEDSGFAEALQSALPQAGPVDKKDTAAQHARPPADLPESAFMPQTPDIPVEEDVFGKAMRGVAPLVSKGRAIAPATAAPLGGVPPEDPAKALRDVLEGRVEFALYHSDEYMEGHVVGVDPAILGRMRAGQLSPEAHLDLHGQNARQAFDALTSFIKNAYQRSLRTVVVVTGRGKNSPGGVGVLRSMLQEWLTKDPFKRVTLAFCTAQASDGGPGAVYVLLRKYKKSRGKIIWERAASEADNDV